jgi:hypothetical protein
LEKAGCVGPTFTGIVINLLLYADDMLIMGLKTIVNQLNFGVGIRRNSSLRLLLHLLFFMDVKYGAVVSLVNPGER